MNVQTGNNQVQNHYYASAGGNQQAQGNADAQAALGRVSNPGNASAANKDGYGVLDSIARSAPESPEGIYARAAHSASGVKAFADSVNRLQVAAFGQLAAGINGPVGAALASLGTEALTACEGDDEARRMGHAIMSAVKDHGNAAEQTYAKAVLAAVPQAQYVEDGTAKKVFGQAFADIKGGVNADTDKAIAGLGVKLGDLAQVPADAALAGTRLLKVMAETGDNKNATAGYEMSSKLAYATDDLATAQKGLFESVLSGTVNELADPPKEITRTKGTDAMATFGAAVVMQAAIAGATKMIPGGGFGALIAKVFVGGAVYAGSKGLYHGFMERSARAASARRHEPGFVEKGFSDGFKNGIKRNLMGSLMHGTIQSMAHSYVGPPISYAVGPAASAALNYAVGW